MLRVNETRKPFDAIEKTPRMRRCRGVFLDMAAEYGKNFVKEMTIFDKMVCDLKMPGGALIRKKP